MQKAIHGHAKERASLMRSIGSVLRTAMVAWERAAMLLGAISILVLGFLIFASVVGRELFNTSVPDDITLAGLLMIPIIVLPLAYVQSKDGHIAVTVTTDWLPRRFIALLRLIGAAIGLVFFGAIGWFLAGKIPKDFILGNYYDGELDILVWPMKAVFALGIALFIFRLLFDILENLRIVLGKSEADTVNGAE